MWPFIGELMAGGARLSANELAAGTVAAASVPASAAVSPPPPALQPAPSTSAIRSAQFVHRRDDDDKD